MARIVRFGRLYKIAKLTKLFKGFRVMKEKTNLMKYIKDIIKVSIGLERLVFFLIVFLVICHIGTCLWITIAALKMDLEQQKQVDMQTYKGTWIEPYYK